VTAGERKDSSNPAGGTGRRCASLVSYSNYRLLTRLVYIILVTIEYIVTRETEMIEKIKAWKPVKCDKCAQPAMIASYGKYLCGKHGLEHLKSLKKTLIEGIPF